LDILELVARRPEGLTLSAIAEELSVPISSLHGLLRVLQVRDYLTRVPDDRRFRIGPRLLEVSLGYLDVAEPFSTARQAMQVVAEQCDETTHIAILNAREILYVAGAEARRPLGVASRVGTRLPAHATAAGKALLATLSREQLVDLYADADWPRLTPVTPSSLDALQHELDEVRWAGYAHDVEGVDAGLQCVASVFPSSSAKPTVALSVSVPTARLRGDRLWEIVDALRGSTSSRSDPPRHHVCPLIGWSLATTEDETHREMRHAAGAAMTPLGGQILWADAHHDEHKQTADVYRLLEEPLDALLIQPVNAAAADKLFAEAQRRGILAVCFQKQARSRAFDFFAGGDTYQEGCMQGHAIARALDGRGGVLIVEGDPYNDNARNIAQGNRDTLALYPGLEVLDSQPSGHWSPETARAIVEEALAVYGAERLHGIIAANDGMAAGIADALIVHGLAGRIALVGGDGDKEALGLIRTGALAGTAFQDPTALAVAALEYVIGVVKGTAKVADLSRYSVFHAPAGPVVSVLDIPYTWIDARNLPLLETYWLGREPGADARTAS